MVGQEAVLAAVAVVGFAVLVGGQVHAALREARARRWDLQDREAALREHAASQQQAAHRRRGMTLRGPLGR